MHIHTPLCFSLILTDRNNNKSALPCLFTHTSVLSSLFIPRSLFLVYVMFSVFAPAASQALLSQRDANVWLVDVLSENSLGVDRFVSADVVSAVQCSVDSRPVFNSYALSHCATHFSRTGSGGKQTNCQRAVLEAGEKHPLFVFDTYPFLTDNLSPTVHYKRLS